MVSSNYWGTLDEMETLQLPFITKNENYLQYRSITPADVRYKPFYCSEPNSPVTLLLGSFFVESNNNAFS